MTRTSTSGLAAALTAICWCSTAATGTASGVLVPRDGSRAIHVQSHRVNALLEDGLARTTVRQTFVNPHGRTLEAVYLFPLPEGASLVDLALEVGGQRLEGFLAERQTARRAYDAVVSRGRDPALLEQVGRSTFRLSVFPVLPDAETVVELSYIEHVPRTAGAYRYVYPMALEGAPTAVQQDLTFSLEMRSSAPFANVTSPLEDMALDLVSKHRAVASIERIKATLNDDLVVEANVSASEPNLGLHVYQPPEGAAYFAAILTPPELREDQTVPRDLTLVLDTSGSMKGVKMDQAREAGLWLVDHLREHDRLNILLFSNVVRPFATDPVAATPENRERLREFLRAAKPVGGTALGDAVQRACSATKTVGRSAMVVLLTDGLPTVGVTTTPEIVAFASEGERRGLRLFTFGVGQDVDANLLDGVAAAAGGRSEVFRPNAETASRLQRFLTRTASPAIVDLAVTLDGHPVAELYPRPLPEVYLGEQTVLTGRVDLRDAKTLVVTGRHDGREVALTGTLQPPGTSDAALRGSPVARDLFAMHELRYLERSLRLRNGLSDEAYYRALDQGAYSTQDELVAAMVDTSIDTGVQCAYTSLLALLPEDRVSLNPRDSSALDAALARAEARRAELAGSDAAPRQADFEAVEASPGGSADAANGAFLLGRSRGGATAGTPGGPGSPGPGSPTTGGGRPTTGGFTGQRRAGGEGYERWEFWWEHNRVAYLTPRRLGTRLDGALRERVSALLVNLAGQAHADIADAATLALARLNDDREPVAEALMTSLKHPQESVRQSAMLALGQRKTSGALGVLRQILHDEEAGRRITGRSAAIDQVSRACAAAALGLLDDPAAIDDLMAVVSDESLRAQHDLQSLAVLALGLMGREHDRIVPFLVDQMRKRTLGRMVRAQVPIALARLHERTEGGSSEAKATVPLLVETLLDSKTDQDLARSLVISLGVLASIRQPAALNALMEVVRSSTDDQARHWAFIAIAQIGSRDVSESEHHARIESFLTQEFERPSKPRHLPYATLASSIYAEGRSDPELRERIGTALTEALDVVNNPSDLGAIAIGLGILRFEPAAEPLWKTFDGTRSQPLKGYVGLSLGMLGAKEHAPVFRQLLVTKGLEYKFRLQLARALGAMNDAEAAPTLLKAMEGAETLSEAAASCQGLGMIGTAKEVEALCALASDATQQPLVRGFACVALGLIAEEGDEPWTAQFSVNANYRAKTPSLAEILDLL